MKSICPICAQTPGSHSLRQVSPGVFYTKPAEASQYWDRDGILAHYEAVLERHQGSWALIFDADGFTLKHLMHVDVAFAVAKFITTRSPERMIVKNPTWIVNLAFDLLSPFLNKYETTYIIEHNEYVVRKLSAQKNQRISSNEQSTTEKV